MTSSQLGRGVVDGRLHVQLLALGGRDARSHRPPVDRVGHAHARCANRVVAPRAHRVLDRLLGAPQRQDHGLGPAGTAPVVGALVAEVLGADRTHVPALVERLRIEIAVVLLVVEDLDPDHAVVGGRHVGEVVPVEAGVGRVQRLGAGVVEGREPVRAAAERDSAGEPRVEGVHRRVAAVALGVRFVAREVHVDVAEAVRGPLEPAERGEAGRRGGARLLERRVPLAEGVERVDRVGERALRHDHGVGAVVARDDRQVRVVRVVGPAHEVEAELLARRIEGRRPRSRPAVRVAGVLVQRTDERCGRDRLRGRRHQQRDAQRDSPQYPTHTWGRDARSPGPVNGYSVNDW